VIIVNKMEKEKIPEVVSEFVNDLVKDLSDQDYMDVLYEISGDLKTFADAKAEELGK